MYRPIRYNSYDTCTYRIIYEHVRYAFTIQYFVRDSTICIAYCTILTPNTYDKGYSDTILSNWSIN